MRAGELNRRIQLQSVTRTQDGFGQMSESWSTVATVWASIEPLVGREFYEARQINDKTWVKFRIRYRSGLDTSMRIVDPETSLVYDIRSIVHYRHDRRETVLMATNTNDEI